MSWRLVIAGLLVNFFWLAPAGAQSLADESGRQLYLRFCASCHGPTGNGDGPVGSQLDVMVPNLTGLAHRYGDRFNQIQMREIIDGRAAVVAHGTRTMPVWGYEFWVEEGADMQAEASVRTIVDKLIAYIRSMQELSPEN
ncbi:MAG: c-type cytochrome [Gammaproteobacteria bacterium]